MAAGHSPDRPRNRHHAAIRGLWEQLPEMPVKQAAAGRFGESVRGSMKKIWFS
jgi:hypothetical protein